MTGPVRVLFAQHAEAARFLTVGGICFLVTCSITYALKLSVLAAKPVTALAIATIVATVLSYLLNREWAFRTRGGRTQLVEVALFFAINGAAIVINALPLWVARYVLDLRTPDVSRLVQELSDLTFGLLAGTALAMAFRLWAYRRWVFPRKIARPLRARSGPSSGCVSKSRTRHHGAFTRSGRDQTLDDGPHKEATCSRSMIRSSSPAPRRP